MAADLNTLTPEFRAQVELLMERCKARGYEVRAYVSLRTPAEQARLWRQSRSAEQIAQAIGKLESGGATFLAGTLRDAGPQHGDPVTNALPGMSWHQWGEAVDCFWLVGGQAEWSPQKLVNGLNGYRVYAEEARAIGLTAGGFFTSLKDWPHVQLQAAGSPEATMSLADIDAAMKARFGA